jgi:putative oxidoreductase
MTPAAGLHGDRRPMAHNSYPVAIAIQWLCGFMEQRGLKPGERWATLAGAAEFGGGLLTAMGLGGSIGPTTTIAPMTMAISTVYWGKPIWATEGGGELPLTNASIGAALAMAGPGRISLDHLLGIRVPAWLSVLTLIGTAAGISFALMSRLLAMEEQEQAPELPERAADPAEEPTIEEQRAA